MTVYIITQLKFKNRDAYNRYQSRFMDVFRRFTGSVLIADEHPKVLEGRWDQEKLVMTSFPDEDAANQFMQDPEFQEIVKDRRIGVDATILLAKGFTRAET